MTASNRQKAGSGLGRALGPFLWVATSFLVFVLLFFDPVGIHPLDGWLQERLGLQAAEPAQRDSSAESDRLWTCGMHPHVLEEEPGQCPICGMDLVPVVASGSGTVMGRESEREVLFYRHPMDPAVTSPAPAKDEMGMDYLPVYADETAAVTGAVVVIDPAVVQNMNVQSTPVTRRDLTREIRTVGYLEYDQERMVTVTTKYSGWVEKVYVNHVGEPVRRGQPLFEIYSPELVQTEQELLSAIQYARKFEGADADALRRAQALVDAARSRLSFWDIAPDQIARLEETGEIFRTLKVVAPSSGLVMKRMAGLEGMALSPGMETYHIADLSSLWLSVEVFEGQLAWIGPGSAADVSFTYFPGEAFRGTVRFIEPELSEKTRTLRVKLEVPNPGRRLRAGMFATVTFEPVAARGVLTVPSLAVLRTGQRDVVVLDEGGGRFSPRNVTLGHQGARYVEVLEGLAEGDRVVTSAQFLIDSEASLQEAIQKMIAQRRGEPASNGVGDAQ